jgi:Sec-independent protein translocase protein TatA
MWPNMAELGIVLLIVFLVVGAGKFPLWGDAFGEWLDRFKR